MSYKMIDVSSYQGHPDWEQVRKAGYVGGILRIWNSKGVDTSWEYNYHACERADILRGAYRYSYALTTSQARAEAQEVLQTLQGRKLELGVWLDLEWKNQRALGSAKVKQIADTWMKTIRRAGYVTFTAIWTGIEMFAAVWMPATGLPATRKMTPAYP